MSWTVLMTEVLVASVLPVKMNAFLFLRLRDSMAVGREVARVEGQSRPPGGGCCGRFRLELPC